MRKLNKAFTKADKIREIRELDEAKFMNVAKKFIPSNSEKEQNVFYIRQIKEIYWIFQKLNLTKDDIFDIASDISEITRYPNIGIIMYEIANNAIITNYSYPRR